MKYVQLGILAALVLVATLLGLNLMKDSRQTSALDPIPATAAEADTAKAAESDIPLPAMIEPPAPVEGTEPPPPAAPERKAVPETARREPAVTTPPRAVDRPSPGTPRPVTVSTAPASVPPAPRAESIQVDPPQSTQSLPDPPVETASLGTDQNRYELMRPERQTPQRPEPQAVSVPPAPVEPPRTVVIPSGTILTVRMGQHLSSESSSEGDTFTATLDQPLVFEDLVIAERGSRVEGRVVQAEEGGRVKGVASLALQLTKISTSDGQTAAVQTQTFIWDAPKSVKGDAAKVGIATGVGAALGAIFGGGKGAAIGAGVGAGAGTGTVLATKGKPAEIDAETRVNFRLDQPLQLTEKINQ